MLASKNAMATIAVKDLAVAKNFYQQVLGLSPADIEQSGVLTLRSGKSTIVVYESQFAGTNRATSATWGVGDEMGSVVQSLRKAGVVFERYEMPGFSFDDGVYIAGDFKAAWFKDPDGNILHINNK